MVRNLARLAVAALLSAPVLGVVGVAAPANACAAADPYSGACVTPVNYKISGTDGTVAVQATPKVGNVKSTLKEGATVGVICQINDGGTDTYDNLLSRTWDYTTAGGWVYDHFVTTPAQDGNGWSPGVRHCDSPPSSPLNPNAYPWPTQDAWVADGHGYYEGECTSFAAWAVRSDGLHHTKSPDWLGNADMWHGASVDASPHVGDVAQWDDNHNQAGDKGHVAYVAAVYNNGTIKVEEYNWGNFHRLNIRTISASAPSRYLRF
ncbi:hypothetical protein GCM10023196_094720 [Actinoallomurus vinaceus]|uniref:Peptidase C51 domain-containing protein n=1 Tax=Actinoallomurus vinaceus TaxID=1080074 RepID=A0ABP8URT4_9ACTN